jgi:hypothetical protein
MAGGTPGMRRAMVIGSSLVMQLQGRGCRVFSSDLRVASSDRPHQLSRRFCGLRPLSGIPNQETVLNPVLVEV